MPSTYTVNTIANMVELSQAKPGDVANVTQAGVAYMKNDASPPSMANGWQIPAINISQAISNFEKGLYVPGVSVNGFNGTPNNKKGSPQTGKATTSTIYKFGTASAANGGDILLIVNGVKYSVAAVSLSTIHNQIPTFSAVIDGKAFSGGSLPIAPRKPTLSELNEVRTELMKYIYNSDVTVRLSLSAESSSDYQFIDIREWIIAGVGNASVNARGAYSISIVAAHPAIMADTVHTTIFNSKNISDPPDMSERPNLHLKTVEAIDKYVELTKDEEMYVQTDGAVIDFSKFAGRITKANAVLRDKFEWNSRGGSDLPIFPKMPSTIGKDITAYFDDILWHTVVASSNGNHSPLALLQMFTQPDAGYSIGLDGGFTDFPITMSPQVFWGKPTGTIYDDEIADMACPGESSYPVAGVICPLPMQTSVDPAHFNEDHGDQRVDSCGAYLKPAENGEVGPVYRIYLPSWLVSYTTYISNSVEEFPELDRNITYFGAPDAITAPKEHWKDYELIASAWAKNRFLELYSSGKRCSLQTRLMINNPNFDTFENAVRTGESVAIKSRITDEVIFYFYVLEVYHVIDAQDAKAYTNIVGAYVRPPEGIPAAEISPSDVSGGIDNILYGTKGGLI